MERITILWNNPDVTGMVSANSGTLLLNGEGAAGEEGSRFQIGACSRLQLELRGGQVQPGALATVITVRVDGREGGGQGFSFFWRDVTEACPIYIREYGVIVTHGQYSGSYAQLAEKLEQRGGVRELDRLAIEPEEGYDAAAAATDALRCPIWLGLSRDVRLFEADFRGMGDADDDRAWDCVRPRLHGQRLFIPETGGAPVYYYYLLGRGLGCERKLSRSLELQKYPIAHCLIEDGEVHYQNTAFASYEFSPLNDKALQGTHYLEADQYGHGYMFTPEQQAEYEQLAAGAAGAGELEETVYYSRTVATNHAHVPRYAWFKSPFPAKLEYAYDGEQGFASYPSGQVFAICKFNGLPMPQEEIAVLLQPGESASFEFYLPHRPISRERAKVLIARQFAARHAECLAFWQKKLEQTTRIELPEPRIAEMMQAGFMHLDLISYGLEPEGTLVPTTGVYTAIGSESSPIIQYYDSVGAYRLAERSLQFFLDKQHDDGFIQNFGGYMLETGAALWSMGEHYRHVRDEQWISRIKPHLLKAYRYLLSWRQRNLREELRGRGYGMLEGKTADPEDHFRSYMLNGYAYLGLNRVAEMLQINEPGLAEQIAADAMALKQDIIASFRETLVHSPVVPLADGSWVPTAAPWAEHTGPLSLYADGGKWGTHGSIVARDSLLGPLYLVLQEVLDPNAPEVAMLLHYHNELMCLRNVALSQPYYSIHPWIHLKRREPKLFLKAFYNGMAGLADRETYTFWEHYWHVSPHKTHEEGWFLMQCRWMLYMEEGQELRLLPGIPHDWLKHGKRIVLERASSYFGLFSLEVESSLATGEILASITFHTERLPEQVELRLPHPQGHKAAVANNGTYCAEEESVRFVPASGTTELRLTFSS
ncbi:hypothetical protein M6D81_25400 [Paenibacillus sp. J5C_2022]|uniref:hypothetical protein n=1 Tax=Paenibacillus sp. J5C2022 TaxID=2977129 RepID=UPI0021CE2767|nr:hypothetical protein [Paenibacillus sp. J5C2022]MCU6712038.1 hypothetical protein [Paenibacillus sp. J5C2022]